ncbi:hypothetical protein [Rhodococcus sp. SJ-3]|uniref:hypothetical protein n=1 Tax=Rhodococcus sp. SJ-3 TaxID=3454628 RepID=UPI003F7B0CC3
MSDGTGRAVSSRGPRELRDVLEQLDDGLHAQLSWVAGTCTAAIRPATDDPGIFRGEQALSCHPGVGSAALL